MKNIIIAISSLLIGLGITIFSIISIKSYNEKMASYVETTAIVVGYNYSTDDEGDELAAIIAEYKVERETYRINSSSYSTSTKALGTKVKVKYNPKDPSDAIFVDDKSSFFVLFMGLLFTGIGIYALIKISKNEI